MSGYHGHNRSADNGGPRGVLRSYASSLKENESLFNSYEHLQGLTRGDDALNMLRKIASIVKPIMRKRNWKVQILSEFLPPEHNLLGLNINKGYKICIRLRYHHNPDLFLTLEETVDTMLHELSHNVWGPHDDKFHALWDELRNEHETLLLKGYTGEGFLSEGHKLGGTRNGVPPPHEIRRLARVEAEKRKQRGKLTKGSGQRLGGTPLHLHGRNIRDIIADSVKRRTTINNGCGSGRKDAGALSNQSANGTFKTKAEEDDANNRAIAQALYELMQQEEEGKLSDYAAKNPTGGGLAWNPEHGLYEPGVESPPISKPSQKRAKTNNTSPLSEEEQLSWAIKASMNDAASGDSPTVSPISPDQTLQSNSLPRSQPDKNDKEQPSNSPNQIGSRGRPIDLGDDSDSSNRSDSSIRPGSPVIDISEPFNPDQWTCEICTCINPVRYLACDACAAERPQPSAPVSRRPTPNPMTSRWNLPPIAPPTTLGWNCSRCETFMEHKWWTCSVCGLMKDSS